MKLGEQVRYAYDPTLTGEVVSVEPDGIRVTWRWGGRTVTGLHHPAMLELVMQQASVS